MKSFKPLIAALFVGSLSRAQETSCIETCGTAAFEGAIAGGCGEEDVECFCGNETIVLNFRDCLYADCPTVDEAEDVIVSLYVGCADAGVELTIPLAPEGFPDPELPPECLETCILRIVEVGAEIGCDEEDLQCFCDNQAIIAPPLVECAYSECQGENEIAAIEEYASEACEFVEVPITVPISPTAPTTPATPTADATETASPTSPPPATVTGGAVSKAAPAAGLAAVGIAALLV